MTGQSLKLGKFMTDQVANMFSHVQWPSVISIPAVNNKMILHEDCELVLMGYLKNRKIHAGQYISKVAPKTGLFWNEPWYS